MSIQSVVIAGEVADMNALPVTLRRTIKDRILNVYSKLRVRYEDLLPGELSTPSSGSWEFEVASPEAALTIAVHFYSGLLSKHDVRSRMTVTLEDGQSAQGGDGAGSGSTLEAHFPSGLDPAVRLAFAQMVDVAGHLMDSWTDGQATGVYLKLERPDASQKELGLDWSPKTVSQSAVSQFLEAAEWDLLERTLERSRELFGQ